MLPDTALFGAANAVRCSIEFFGGDRIQFGSNSPFDPEKGRGYIRSTIATVESLDITDAERQAIYEGSARRLLQL